MAEVDFNVVGTDAGRYVELQGTAEGKPFSRDELANAPRPCRNRARATLRGPGRRPRHRPAVSLAGRACWSRRVRGTSSPSCATCSTCHAASSSTSTMWGSTARSRRPARPSLSTPPSRRVPTPGAPGCRRWPTTRGWRSTRSAAGLASAPGAMRASRRPTPTTTRSSWRPCRASRRSAAAPATAASWPWPYPGSPGRAAASRCVLARGTFAGRIGSVPRGSNGFGYDPIFEPATEPPGGATVGEWPPERKRAVSHRARAARRMAPRLAGLAG